MRAVIKCPDTDREFDIDIPTSAAEVARCWRQTIATACPHCNGTHLEGFRQLYVEAILGPANWNGVC